MTSTDGLAVPQLIEELADAADETRFLRRFIERVLVGQGFASWVRFHVALQDYSPIVRDAAWPRIYLDVIAKAAAMETEGGTPGSNVLTSMSTGRRDYVAMSKRRRRTEG